MLFIALFFFAFALFLLARIVRGIQAAWMGMVLFTFGCSLIGLVGLISRFSNYNLEVLDLPLDQPVWFWNLLERLSLYRLVRFRLWAGIGFIIAVVMFSLAYTSFRLKRQEKIVLGGTALMGFSMLWYYDPNHLFGLYQHSAALVHLPPYPTYMAWEARLLFYDRLFLVFTALILFYALFRIARFLLRCTILQKRIQAFFVGTGITVLSMLFLFLFCIGPGSIFNGQVMATTLLPLGRDYPFFNIAQLRIVPLAALAVLVGVGFSMRWYGFLGTFRIVTRDLDRQIHTANKAVRMALHAFKNQFLGVRMAMDMAEMSLSAIENPSVHETLTRIESAKSISEKALARLDVLQSQAQRLELHLRKLSWVKLWDQTKRHCSADLSNMELKEGIQSEKMDLWGDGEHLEAVLENLLQNAVEAISGKECSDNKPRIFVEIGEEYEWTYFRIRDNGPGIPRENLHRIFQPFFSTKPSHSNWGLGLAYCHRVIKMHGGYINVSSKPGEGATFEVVLRCRENLHA